MIPQQYRLKRMKDFEILFKEGYFVVSDLITAKIWKIEPEKYSRRGYNKTDLKIGFVVGLKVSKKAVWRNRLKRQMREVVRLLLKEDKIRAGFMAALVAKPGALGKEYEEIAKSIMVVLKKGNMLK